MFPFFPAPMNIGVGGMRVVVYFHDEFIRDDILFSKSLTNPRLVLKAI